MRKKLEILDIEYEDVHGDVRRARMNLQDREKLLIKSQAKEKWYGLKNKVTLFLKNKVDFTNVGYKDDELNLIEDQIVNLNAKIESVDQKSHNLQTNKADD